MTFLELSLSGGVFILAIAAFRGLTLRRLPKGTFVALWWLAAARLLLPVELASRFSVYTLLEVLGPKSVPAVPGALRAPVVPMIPVAPACSGESVWLLSKEAKSRSGDPSNSLPMSSSVSAF